MNIIKGDLIKYALDGKFDIIVHGCNCYHTMGGGIAKQIKKTFPQAYQADKKTILGDINKLGNYTAATIPGKLLKSNKNLTIINGYTQYDFRGRGIKVDYNAVKQLFKNIKKNYSGKSIGFPRIGAGLAGGDWKTISEIINKELSGENFTLVEYVP